ncbi:MAG: hypothetical protein QGG48_09530 [Desulfatiglandales bacterium]|jgi:hypothetical protein|nr:hypothetical protein [Desulfatiglandales bacterium]
MLCVDLDILKATLFAMLYGGLYTLVAMGPNRVIRLDYGVLIFWAVGLRLSLTFSSLRLYYLITHFSTFLYRSLFFAAFFPMAFARWRTHEVFWETELFITINLIITLV